MAAALSEAVSSRLYLLSNNRVECLISPNTKCSKVWEVRFMEVSVFGVVLTCCVLYMVRFMNYYSFTLLLKTTSTH